MDIATAFRDWKMDLRAANRSPRTIETYDLAIRSFLASSGGEITRRAVRDWLASIAGKADSTRAVSFTVLRTFIKWLISEGLLDSDPSAGIPAPQATAPKVDPLTRQEIRALIKTAEGRPQDPKNPGQAARDKAILLTLISSGMRISECAGILIPNLDLDQRRVLILGKAANGKPKWRTAPLDVKAAQAIARYQRRERNLYAHAARDDRLWLSRQGPLSSHAIDSVIKGIAKEAGIPGVHAHLFRHTFAHRWLEDGGSESSLMAICGWESRRMMDRYTRTRAADRALAEYQKLRS